MCAKCLPIDVVNLLVLNYAIGPRLPNLVSSPFACPEVSAFLISSFYSR